MPTPAIPSKFGTLSSVVAYAVVFLSLAALLEPMFLPGFLIGHDGGVHQTYVFLMNRALRQGQFPVRWVEGLHPGLGQPLFNYYQVGFYYLVELIHACGFALSLAFKLAIAAAWIGGPIFMFLLCEPLGAMPAALAAAVWAWSPYLLLDVYVRTAFPEFTAMACAPGVLWSIDRLLRTGRPIFVATLALTTAVLLISHLPTALMVAPVAAAYAVGAWTVHRYSLNRIARVAAGALLGAGLAAFYVLPAILELNAIQVSQLTKGYFDFHLHFVRAAWWVKWSWGRGASGVGDPDQISMQIGIVQWIVLTCGLMVLALPPLRRRAGGQAKAIAGWLAVVAVSMFMMTSASVRIWELMKPLAFIQFPWRLLMIPSLACGVLAALVLSTVRHRIVQALVVLSVVGLQWYVVEDYRQEAEAHQHSDIFIDSRGWPNTPNADTWVFREDGYDPISVPHQRKKAAVTGRWTTDSGVADVDGIVVKDARLQLRVRASAPAQLVINSPFLPGWRIAIDDRPVVPSVRSDSGFMEIEVPSGVHQVDADFGNTPIRTAADTISLASAVAWIVLLVTAMRSRERQPVAG